MNSLSCRCRFLVAAPRTLSPSHLHGYFLAAPQPLPLRRLCDRREQGKRLFGWRYHHHLQPATSVRGVRNGMEWHTTDDVQERSPLLLTHYSPLAAPLRLLIPHRFRQPRLRLLPLLGVAAHEVEDDVRVLQHGLPAHPVLADNVEKVAAVPVADLQLRTETLTATNVTVCFSDERISSAIDLSGSSPPRRFVQGGRSQRIPS